MQVYFSRLEDGNWICYDELNTTGDLFVDPAKIELLTKHAKLNVPHSSMSCSVFDTELKAIGFNPIKCDLTILICPDGTFNNVMLHNKEGKIIATDLSSFMVHIPELPKFAPYPYPDNEESDEGSEL